MFTTMSGSTNSTNDSKGTEAAGRCPVDHKNGASSLWKVFGRNAATTAAIDRGSSVSSPITTASTVPASLEEAAKHAQTPHPEQRLPLSTHRSLSSIPRGVTPGKEVPHHQLVVGDNGGGDDKSPDNSNWVYPSEQQVFNAMKRKGWNGIEEESIPSFLQIHNSVNERSWRQLCEWEKDSPKGGGGDGKESNLELVRFEGRPQDLTPKAWFLSTFMFQDKPFDRHDWYIDNGIDSEKRYVLDFYMHENSPRSGAVAAGSGGGSLPRVEIDVRPALDSPQAVLQRGQRIAKELFPGIAKELENWQSYYFATQTSGSSSSSNSSSRSDNNTTSFSRSHQDSQVSPTSST